MTSKKFLTIFFIFSFSCISAKAQSPDYTTQWKKIDGLEKKGLTKDALNGAINIFNDAAAKRNDPQVIKSAMYQMKYRSMITEGSSEKNIFYLDTLIAKTNAPAKNILLSMQAELFNGYREAHRYQLYNRTALAEEKGNDITTWSIAKLNEKIVVLYKASLINEPLLKATPIKNFKAILDTGNTGNLRPTVYDLLAHRALDYFMSTENDVTNPSYKFIINDEAAFAPATEFINHRFFTKDSSSLYYNALMIFQNLLRFHLTDKQPEALLDADLDRLSFIKEHGIFADKDILYESALQNIEANYSHYPASAQASYLRALLHKEKGNSYDAKSGKENQFELATAKQVAEAAYLKFPKSEGGINSKNLIAEIETPALSFETEEVNVPAQPFRLLVQYKNTAKVFFRLIKTTRELIKRNELIDDDKEWRSILNLTPLRSWSVDLPDEKDYQQHSTEIKADALPAGVYYLLMSRNANFSLAENIIGRAVTCVSSISYLLNSDNDIYVLDRESGEPIAGAAVQFWVKAYNNSSRQYEDKKAGNYTTDKNGYAKISASKNYESRLVQVKTNKDELFTDDEHYYYSYNSYDNSKAEKMQTFLFTDRAIYRPGQTVFFKGIITDTDSSGRKSNIIAGRETVVELYDQNSQKLNRIKLTSNDYGSYNGKFIIPEGLLNGNFSLQDSLTGSSQSFSVEEYKRPTFSAEIKKPAGSYRVNDSIQITGIAKAYAGNDLYGAKVSYHVVRIARYPVWFGYYRQPFREIPEQEITSGNATTNDKGEFFISFKALPDETARKEDQPIFDYRVTADVTDISGETRSASQTVSVSYEALQLNIIADEKLPADSIQHISISSRNANDIFEKATVHFTLYKLQEPGRIFRKRYWDMPDTFVMSKDEYQRDFPYDIYADEDNMSKWPVANEVLNIIDTTAETNSFNIPAAKPAAGWYKIVISAKDKFGEEARAEKFIQLTVRENQNIGDPINITKEKETAEPGEKINYGITTGFDKIFLIENTIRSGDNIKADQFIIKKSAASKKDITVTEQDSGGIALNYAFVKHNCFYSGNESFFVPWSNEELQISYETFRDKTEPGSNEKWKIKIGGSRSEKVVAETLISMYDASLDQFKAHSWSSLNTLWPANNVSFNWDTNDFTKLIYSQSKTTIPSENIGLFEKNYSGLSYLLWDIDNESPRHMLLPKPMGLYAERMAANNISISDLTNSPGAFEPAAIRIRGIRSITGNKDPMLVIDGVPTPLSYLGSIRPEDILTEILLKGETAISIYGAQAANGAIIITTKKSLSAQGLNDIKLRKNFNETAFFYPDLKTDSAGDVQFSFTMPEALTQWKLMVLAHTKELASAYSSKTTVTQKQLMVQPNAPRFLREGDRMEFSAKIVNLTAKEITGTSTLELLDAATNKPVDGWFKNVFPLQYFTVPGGQSVAVKFPIDIPTNFNSAMTWRIKAISKDASFSDGEEAAIPVLNNRTLVTETLPLNLRNTNAKAFKFDKLLNAASAGGSLTNHALTVEYTSNPAWYAVQALPYLAEYPYECAEHSFNRYYANVLASFISNSSPKMKTVFDKWATAKGDADTAVLLSNLQKNEELKSALLEETPWVLDAQNETQQKKNIALLFNMVRLAAEKNKTLAKLKDMQSSNGGFAWFKGGEDDRYITQYIISGIGHLRKLNALSGADYSELKLIVDKALPYIDARLKDEYDELKKEKVRLADDHLSYTAIQYLYMRSFFAETNISSSAKAAADYYTAQAAKYWPSENKYMQAVIALAMYRSGDMKTAKAIIESLKQNAINDEEFGMYWKELARGGYYWYQAPIESQAMMIEAFTDIDKNISTINDLKTWLLKQKQTQEWPTTKATAEACYALLLAGSDWLKEEKAVTIQLGKTIINSTDEKSETGTGYFKKRIDGDDVNPEMGNISVTVKSLTNQSITQSISYGSVYWQYFQDLDKITSSATPLKLVKKLFVEKNSDKGPVLRPVNDGDELKVGDKIKVRIELRADRDLEYVHMKDLRAACMEPVNVLSGYKYQGGLGYYETTKDASTNFFFGWLPKGTYVFEYPMFVTHAGNFSNGITTIQCMYAPEFTARSEGLRVSAGE